MPAATKGLPRRETRLRARGHPHPRGARWWNISTVKRIIENDVYLTRPYEEVAGLVSPEVAAKLDPDQGYGLYWFGRIRMRRNYGPRQKSTKFTVEHNDRKEWIAIPVPDSGIPPEWVQTARERGWRTMCAGLPTLALR